MRSVHTERSTHSQREQVSPACLVSGTSAACFSFFMVASHPPSCPPSLQPHYKAFFTTTRTRTPVVSLSETSGLPMLTSHCLLHIHSVSNHLMPCPADFSSYPCSRRTVPFSRGSDFAIHSQARQGIRPNRVPRVQTGCFSSVPPTPPHDDAVTVDYGPGELWPGRDLHPPDSVRSWAHE